MKLKTKSRISSILETSSLDSSVTGLPTLDLSQLDLIGNLEFSLPTNKRLGHLAEKIVGELIKASSNYKILYENIQIIEEKRTIGEIDFIIQEIKTKQIIHLELAYKFYLFDPNISSEPINNWIGPNRNDSLKEKLKKLKSKQFPLLYHECASSKFNDIKVDLVTQTLCLLVSLFIPYEYKESLPPIYTKAIKGYYLRLEQFKNHDHSTKTYFIPSKKEWGMDPCENEIWNDFNGVEACIVRSLQERKAPLCWQKQGDSYSTFFIVWW